MEIKNTWKLLQCLDKTTYLFFKVSSQILSAFSVPINYLVSVEIDIEILWLQVAFPLSYHIEIICSTNLKWLECYNKKLKSCLCKHNTFTWRPCTVVSWLYLCIFKYKLKSVKPPAAPVFRNKSKKYNFLRQNEWRQVD